MALHIISNKPTTGPIEIPRRRRPVISRHSASSIGRPTSPDLIFEMSPISSELSSPRCAFSFAASQELEQEPFMYHFPVLATRLHSDRRTRPTSTAMSSPPANIPSIPSTKHRRSPLSQLNSDDNLTCPSTTTKFMSTTKITGFTPPMQHPLPSPTPYSSVRPLKSRRLSPPPHSSSYSSLPWILPGKSDILEEESSSLEPDLAAFDFEKYLMQRIENQNQNPLHFRLMASIKG